MAGSIYSWSTTAGSNSNSDADINWNEGQAASTVNNSARQMMGRVAEWVKDQGGTLVAGGTANAINVTANSAFSSYATGLKLAFRAGAANTAAATLSANTLGAKAIRKFNATGEVALAPNDIQGNGIYEVVYDAAAHLGAGAWVLLNPSPGKPAFRAHRNGVNQIGIANGVYTKFAATSEAFDIGNCFDVANSRWTPSAGVVHLTGTVQSTGAAGTVIIGEQINGAIYKNGALLGQTLFRADANGVETGTTVSVTDQASGTDYYEFFVMAFWNSWAINGTAARSFFCGHMV